MRVSMRLLVLGLVAGCAEALGAGHRRSRDAAKHRGRANPIRKVVTLLQKMQAKVEEEAETELKLHDKFMCYCETSNSDLTKSIGAAEVKIPQLESDIKKTAEQKTQKEDDVAQANADRTSAKTAIAEATAIREKEAKAFAAEKAELEADINAVNGAVAALEKGAYGSLLQTSKAKALERLAKDSQDLIEEDRQELLSFLEGTQDSDYAPASGEIIGILKQLGDEMAKALSEATATEDDAIKAFNELVAAKTKELTALQTVIEDKLGQIGELGVAVSQMKNDLVDTGEALEADKQFLAELGKTCAAKKVEWEETVKTRGAELSALAETIKMLNDDDALELFKKTLPSASSASSFLQVQVTSEEVSERAQSLVRKARGSGTRYHAKVDLIAQLLRGKKVGFDAIIGMIDKMVVSLKKEQGDDDEQKAYCAEQFDLTEDNKKQLTRALSDKEKAIASAEEGIASSKEEIAAIEASIKELDTSVEEATQQRKDENQEYKDLMASDGAAKELLIMAQNRLDKFYNPKLYKPPPKVELSAEDRIVENFGGASFVQVSARARLQHKAAPPPPPETGSYSKKSEESTGVSALMNILIKDLDKEMTEATAEEKDAQADYEQMMADSSAKRSADAKSLTEKESTKASLEGALETHQEERGATAQELQATNEYEQSLHLECDWLDKYYPVRKQARTDEIDSLGKAKDVLRGADYS